MPDSRRVTRASNAKKHPGQVVIDSIQKRKSAEEATRARVAIASQQEQQRLEQAAKLAHLKTAQHQEEEAQRKIDEVAIKVATVPQKRKKIASSNDEVEILQTPKNAGSSSVKRHGAQKIRRIQIEDEEQTMDIDFESDSEVQQQAPSDVEPSDLEIQATKAKNAFRKTNTFRAGWEPHSPSVSVLDSEIVPDDFSGYGGFMGDEDDDQVERSVAVSDGVPAIHTAQASKSLAIIKRSSHPLPSSSTEIETTRRENGAPQATMAHLPPDVNRSIYSRYFIPTFFHIVSEHNTPFTLAGTKLMEKLAKAFKGCFPGLDYEMTTKAIIFLVGQQRYYELRRKYAIACQNFLTDFFNSTPTLQTPESRAKYVAAQGVGSTGDFLYAQIKPYRQGAFCSDIVLSAFSLHLTSITGTIRTSFHKPIGALALAATAAERALVMYNTGTLSKSPGSGKHEDNPAVFSATYWSTPCSEYMEDIIKLSKDDWKEIEDRAAMFVKKRGKLPAPPQQDDQNVPRQRQRAHIRNQVPDEL